MGSIFVSHSKHDKELVNNFALICARAGLQINVMELEDVKTSYAGSQISQIIRKESDCVVVLLGRNLAYPHLTPHNILIIGSTSRLVQRSVAERMYGSLKSLVRISPFPFPMLQIL